MLLSCAGTVSCAAKSEKVSSSMRRMSGLRFIPRMRKVLSGQLLSTGTFYSVSWFLKRTVKAIFRLCRWAGWCRFSSHMPEDTLSPAGAAMLMYFYLGDWIHLVAAKGHNLSDFLFAFLHSKSFWNSVYSTRKEFVPKGSTFFPFRVASISDGPKIFDSATCPETVSNRLI